MRRSLGLLATFGSAVQAIRSGRDEANIRRLARHLGCSVADARRLYHLARRDGYGAAYEAVFSSSVGHGAAVSPREPGAEQPEGATPEQPITFPRPA